MSDFQDRYRLVQNRRLEAAIHKDWQEPLGDLRRLFPQISRDPEMIERGRFGQGYTLKREVCGTEMFAKIYLPGRASRRMRDLLGNHRAVREWEAHCRAEDLGIRTATVVAAITSKKFWNCRHLMLTLPAPGRSVRQILPELQEDPARREELLRFLGREIARWHRAGFCHAHLNRSHLFIDDSWNLTTIDLERSFVQDPLPEQERRNNLRQLRGSLAKNLQDSAEFEIFEKAYEKEYRQSDSRVLAPST